MKPRSCCPDMLYVLSEFRPPRGGLLLGLAPVHNPNFRQPIVPDPLAEIKSLLDSRPPEEQREVLRWLRQKHPIHQLEADFGAPADVILEAISRASDLSRRGVLGLIAEAAFKVNVIDALEDWVDDQVVGDVPYDFQISKHDRRVRIQVKRQRLVRGQPMRYPGAPEFFVAETQRSRRGVDTETGEDTRPYRFGEFDILAVCMQPATGDWTSFRFTLGSWLVPRAGQPSWIKVLQPVSLQPNRDWSSSLMESIAWLDAPSARTVRCK